uniref:alpha-N-acetylgalactosamine-specific lectin-like n=1 Tax=Styela clava TaxID=7725 RepID=UPI0019396229|nr:alpha-N-acetylgalactosamine-specific lectin-like [Styela clava]
MDCNIKTCLLFIWLFSLAPELLKGEEPCVRKLRNGRLISEGSCQNPNADDIIKQLRQNVYKKTTWYPAINGFSYKLFREGVTYGNAQLECKKHGAGLASAGIRNRTVFSEIMPLIKVSGLGTWIGLDDIQQEGEFVWQDGVTSTEKNTYWGNTIQPDNSGNEDCVHLQPHAPWNLNDLSCSTPLQFLCEK